MTRTPEDMVDALARPFPPQAIKKRQSGGGKLVDYIETHTAIRRLNDATGGNWDFHVLSIEWRNDLVIALGELTIPGMGTRAGIGVQRVNDKSGDDLVKGVASDSLKKAATLFGVALDLYGPDYEAGELDNRAPAQHPAPRQDAPTRATDAPGHNKASDRQREMIAERWGALRLDPIKLPAQARKWYGAEYARLTRENAEDMIRRLDQKITAASPRGLTPQPAELSPAEITDLADADRMDDDDYAQVVASIDAEHAPDRAALAAHYTS